MFESIGCLGGWSGFRLIWVPAFEGLKDGALVSSCIWVPHPASNSADLVHLFIPSFIQLVTPSDRRAAPACRHTPLACVRRALG